MYFWWFLHVWWCQYKFHLLIKSRRLLHSSPGSPPAFFSDDFLEWLQERQSEDKTKGGCNVRLCRPPMGCELPFGGRWTKNAWALHWDWRIGLDMLGKSRTCSLQNGSLICLMVIYHGRKFKNSLNKCLVKNSCCWNVSIKQPLLNMTCVAFLAILAMAFS